MAEPKTNHRLVKARVRHAEALQLRIAGHTFSEIAQKLGYADESGPYKAVLAALKRIEVPRVEELRALEGSRLDTAQRAIWPKVQAGDLKAINTFVKLSERRARLFGLDSARVNLHAHAIGGGFKIEYIDAGTVIHAPQWAKVIEGSVKDDGNNDDPTPEAAPATS